MILNSDYLLLRRRRCAVVVCFRFSIARVPLVLCPRETTSKCRIQRLCAVEIFGAWVSVLVRPRKLGALDLRGPVSHHYWFHRYFGGPHKGATMCDRSDRSNKFGRREGGRCAFFSLSVSSPSPPYPTVWLKSPPAQCKNLCQEQVLPVSKSCVKTCSFPTCTLDKLTHFHHLSAVNPRNAARHSRLYDRDCIDAQVYSQLPSKALRWNLWSDLRHRILLGLLWHSVPMQRHVFW